MVASNRSRWQEERRPRRTPVFQLFAHRRRIAVAVVQHTCIPPAIVNEERGTISILMDTTNQMVQLRLLAQWRRARGQALPTDVLHSPDTGAIPIRILPSNQIV